jgi:hypothetical protein
MGEWFATLEEAKNHARGLIESYYAASANIVTVTELDGGDKRFMLSTPLQAESLTANEVAARTIELKQNYRDHHSAVVMVLEYTEEVVRESSFGEYIDPHAPIATPTALDIAAGKPSPVVQTLHDSQIHINEQPNVKVYGYEDWLEENPGRAFN